MATGLGTYREVLTDPRARLFSLAGFIARMPMSMTGFGIVLLVSLTSGSFGRAGLVAAFATLAGAASAPWWGRLIDRVGQSRVLVTAAIINNVSLLLLIQTVVAEAPFPLTLASAVGVGLGFSSAGSCVRSRWSHRLSDPHQLNTAFALEAVVDEVVFLTGPVIVTLLATAVHPAMGLVAALVFGLTGSLWLSRMRDTQPPAGGHRDPTSGPAPISVLRLAPIVLASFALGSLFGGMEVVVVAFAKESGLLPLAGLFVTAWSFGSLVSGVLVGTIAWQSPPARRFRVGAVFLAVSLVPLPFVSNPWLVAALLTLSGLAIAPTLIASVAVAQAAVPPQRLTEALGWTSTGLAAGVAAGAAVLGHVVDRYGSSGGFLGEIGAGVLLIAAALAVRTARSGPSVVELPMSGEPLARL